MDKGGNLGDLGMTMKYISFGGAAVFWDIVWRL